MHQVRAAVTTISRGTGDCRCALDSSRYGLRVPRRTETMEWAASHAPGGAACHDLL